MRHQRILISLIIILGAFATLDQWRNSAQSHATAHATPATSLTCLETQPVRDEPTKDPNADRFGFGPWYINSDRTIWAGWDVGSWVSGRKGNKVLWIRPQGAELKVTGRRLDRDAPPLKIYIPCCYPTGFQATRVVFPSAGCWEVTAKAGSSALKFVAKIK